MSEPKERARPELARTMRIDIDPREMVELHAVRRRETTSDSFVARSRKANADTDFGKLLESIYDAVLITDAKGRIVDLNARAVEFFQLTRERMQGMQVLNLIQGADESLLEAIARNLRDHRYTLVEARCLRFEDEGFPSEIAVNRIELDLQTRLCFFIRDITVRKRAFLALEDAVVRLESYDKARSEFVSNVSHELRTPLTSMIYAVHNMLRGVAGPLPDRTIRYLERLDSDCHRLLNTVNDILDLRQIENQSLSLAQKRIPFSILVEECVNAMRVQADEKMIRIAFSEPREMPFVHCDPQKMERVVINLIGNAIKFTPSGGAITVTLASDSEAEDHVLLSVCDTGIGIPAEALSKVTVRYFKVGEQPTGSGLGLAIAKEIVHLHGGKLTLKSPVPGTERGTAVYVRMPLAPAPVILLVCNNSPEHDRLTESLKTHGYRVATVARGDDAAQLASAGKIDAMVLDLNLADTDAFQLLLKVKQDQRLSRLPIVAVNAAVDAAPRDKILHGLNIPHLTAPWLDADVITMLGETFFTKRSVKSA